MSVEALWLVYFGDAALPALIPGYSNAGVIVLETGRLLGGDFGYYYVGKYSVVKDQELVARATITHFNGPLRDAFGLGLKSFEIEIGGTFSDEEMSGWMFPVGHPTRRLPIRLRRAAELPTGVA